MIVTADRLPFLALGVKGQRPFSLGGLPTAWSDLAAPAGTLLASARDIADGEGAWGVLRSLDSDHVQKLVAPRGAGASSRGRLSSARWIEPRRARASRSDLPA